MDKAAWMKKLVELRSVDAGGSTHVWAGTVQAFIEANTDSECGLLDADCERAVWALGQPGTLEVELDFGAGGQFVLARALGMPSRECAGRRFLSSLGAMDANDEEWLSKRRAACAFWVTMSTLIEPVAHESVARVGHHIKELDRRLAALARQAEMDHFGRHGL